MALEAPPGPRTRFAPAPSGPLHVGSARGALFNWLFAHSRGGSFVLRIEDTDPSRVEAGAEAAILEDMRWLGLDWDEGPDIGGPSAPYRQSERHELYRAEASRLLSEASAYRCFCSPQELEDERERALAAGRPLHYSGRCRELSPLEAERRLAEGQGSAVRFRVPQRDIALRDRVKGEVDFPAGSLGDFVVLRADGRASYNFACVVDDAAMSISHVIRGEDLLSSTPKQLLLFEALGYEAPRYAHLPIVLDEQRRKLSKRHGSKPLGWYREQGYLPEALFNALALVGWSPPKGPELLARNEILELFSLERVARANAVFDSSKLDWLNTQHLKRASGEQLLELCASSLLREGLGERPEAGPLRQWLERALLEAARTAEDVPELIERLSVLWRFEPAQAAQRLQRLGSPARALLEDFLRAAGELDLASTGAFKRLTRQLGERHGLKGRALYHPLRLALTGRDSGMELGRLVPLMVEAGGSCAQLVPDPQTRVRRVLELLGSGP